MLSLHSAQPAGGRSRAALGLVVLCVAWAAHGALAPTASAQDQPVLPGADGVATRDWVGDPIRVGDTVVTLGLQIPQDWNTHAVDNTLLFEPDPSPGDLGAIVIVDALDTNDTMRRPEAIFTLLDGIVIGPRETSRETLSLEQSSSSEALSATLLELEARFDNGTPARLLALHIVDGDIVVIALAGAADDVWGPWDASLRDMLLSLELTTSR